jgi:hypothetical protein
LVADDEEPEHDEPFICNTCLVEPKRGLHGAGASQLRNKPGIGGKRPRN